MVHADPACVRIMCISRDLHYPLDLGDPLGVHTGSVFFTSSAIYRRYDRRVNSGFGSPGMRGHLEQAGWRVDPRISDVTVKNTRWP